MAWEDGGGVGRALERGKVREDEGEDLLPPDFPVCKEGESKILCPAMENLRSSHK
jgi:hypothetical protein